ncbi:hypothetical protein PITCH_A1150105 [uncultured Desulfobacterium sp.]|uniref:Uncharacterized protein n=1 Tax=uncultured Desulfobacterium sp. TaxID=201089 RepID=A0A445MRI2_9BACT|nr:hypothetical protein PITCH_A1150105 [uncultured Desulfobacterium sp.]
MVKKIIPHYSINLPFLVCFIKYSDYLLRGQEYYKVIQSTQPVTPGEILKCKKAKTAWP